MSNGTWNSASLKWRRVSAFDSRSWEPQSHHEPYSANNISLSTAPDWRAERAHSPPLGGRLAQLSKENFKIALSICSAISEFIETKLFNKISLDLISGERARSTSFLIWNYLRHFGIPRFPGVQDFFVKSEDIRDRWDRNTAKRVRGNHVPSHLILIGCEEIISGNFIKGTRGFVYHLRSPPKPYQAPPGIRV